MKLKTFSLTLKAAILLVVFLPFLTVSIAQVNHKSETTSINTIDTISHSLSDTSNQLQTTTNPQKNESSNWWDNLWYDLSVEIVGGLLYATLGAILTLTVVRLIRRRRKWRFKQIFGQDIQSYSLIYPSLTLGPVYNNLGQPLQFPYTKASGNFKMSEPVSLADLRAAIYVSDLFFKITSKSPILVPDTHVLAKIDFSYSAFGGLSNDKTKDVLLDKANTFFRFNVGNPVTIERIKDGRLFNNSNLVDLGIIIKVNSSHFPNRTQICIAGLGEYGTSGAAWFLANKWKEIRKTVKNKNFGAIINVRIGKDESATLVELCT